MRLGGATIKRLEEALLSAFPTRDGLTRLVRIGLEQNLEAIAPPGHLRATVFALLMWAEAQGALDTLLAAARAENPGNALLLAFVEERSGVRAPVPFHLPFPSNPAFVGRDRDLEALHDLLLGAPAIGVGALTGLGGIGKTQLAVEYAYRKQGAYPGGVYWVNAAKSWQAELAALADAVGLREDDAPEGDRPRRLAAAFARHLEEHPGALLIFDNVEDPLALQDASLPVVPTRLACKLLFTTRRREPSFPMLPLEVLAESDARALLLAGAKRVAGTEAGLEEAALAICQTLGCLPLAIALAAAYLGRRPKITLAGYLEGLVKHGALRVTEEGKVDPRLLATQHEKGLEATLEEQWNALREEGEARRVLMTAALLGEAAVVPRARFSLLTGLSDRGESWKESALEEALGELGRLSLVEVLTEGAIRLHPLVHEFAERRIGERDMFAGECGRRLGEALWDMGRLHDEVAERGVDAVLGDLRVGMKLSRGEEGDRLEGLIRPLDREAHCLRRWDAVKEPGGFLQQFRNRCFELGKDKGRTRAERALDERGWSWLRERFPVSRESGALVRTLEGHTSFVSGVAVTANGRFAVSASGDTTLKVWDLESGQAVRTLHGHTYPVNGVAVTSDGRFAVSASRDRTLKVWNLESGKAVRTLHGHTYPVNSVAVTSDNRFAVSASSDGTLKIWNLESGTVVRTLYGHTNPVTGVAVTPDGRFVASVSYDLTMKIWDLESGKTIRTFEGHITWITGVTVTNDGRFAVSASEDKTLKVWDLVLGETVRTLEGHRSYVNSAAVTSDGRFAVSASSDKTLKMWDLSTGKTVRTFRGHISYLTGVAVTSNGRFAVSASGDTTLKVWDLASGNNVRTIEGHTDSVDGVAVTSDGLFSVSASKDATLKVQRLASGKAVRTLQGHSVQVNSVAVTADRRFAVSASKDKTLKVWDLATGQAIHTLEGHTLSVEGVSVTPDGRFAVSASDDTTLKMWNLASGQIVCSLEGHISHVTSVAVTADGRFAVSASWDRTLKVWDLASERTLRTLEGHTAAVNGVAVTPDDRFAVSASYDKTLKMWDLASGQVVRTFEGHTDSVLCVAVTTDGRFIVTASLDKTLRVWNLHTGQLLTTLETTAPMKCCTFTPDGKTIVAGDQAGALHILDWIPPPHLIP